MARDKKTVAPKTSRPRIPGTPKTGLGGSASPEATGGEEESPGKASELVILTGLSGSGKASAL